jgi:hypothetical protein
MMPVVFAELVPMATHGVAPALHYAVVQPGEVIIVGIIFSSAAVVLYPLARGLARKLEGEGRAAAPALQGVEDRLDRIERSVEAIALEVERVSEGQRFVTKLLAERTPSQLPPARQ